MLEKRVITQLQVNLGKDRQLGVHGTVKWK